MQLEIPVHEIIIPTNRQRKNIGDITDLAASIRQVGLINPITIRRETKTLIAGERRLSAVKSLGWPTIACRAFEDLSVIDQALIELEENIKRSDLSWQEQASAAKALHEALCALNEGWTLEKTAERISIYPRNLSKWLMVARELGNPLVAKADTRSAAYNHIRRAVSREMDSEMTSMVAALGKPEAEAEAKAEASAQPTKSIFNQSFFDFADIPELRQIPFNFIHCDFPYGINFDKNKITGGGKSQLYADSFELYEGLCQHLCSALSGFAAAGHILFWFSMDHYSFTKELFTKAGLDVNPKPLIWHKTDGRGIIADIRHDPRHIYESAFLMTWGDRDLVRSVANVYGAPTSNEHASAKPEPMLNHFFQMFVDETTLMLDPTCGHGSSLRSAERLGAKLVAGIELNPVTAADAEKQLNGFRALQKLAPKKKKNEEV